MKIIGVAGPARSGKDTVGDYLVKNCGYKRFAFADPMKDMICALLSCTRDWLEAHKDEHIPAIGYSPRELLQTVGTEWGRNTLNKDFWVDITFRQIANMHEGAWAGVVITDCRFENEAKRIRKEGGIIAHIRREEAATVAEHVSEAGIAMKGCDCKLYNNDTIPDLYRAVDFMQKMYPKLVRLGGHV